MRKRKSTGSEVHHYSLKKGLGSWELTFRGKQATLKHEQGLAYVAYLLLNPPEEPIHGLDLAIRVNGLHRPYQGITEIADASTGMAVPVLADARLQQRSLGLEEAETMRRVLRKEEELEALLEDEDQIEPVKLEAQRQLIELYDYEKNNGRKVRDSAQRAVRSVRMAIKRFHERLMKSTDASGRPHPVLRAFGEHVEKYLLLPSARCAVGRSGLTRSEMAGRFTYEAPEGVRWGG